MITLSSLSPNFFADQVDIIQAIPLRRIREQEVRML